MIKKFCTKHGIEYIGETCPECVNPETNIEKTKTPKKKKHKKSPTPSRTVVSDEEMDDKLKALVDKWNNKD